MIDKIKKIKESRMTPNQVYMLNILNNMVRIKTNNNSVYTIFKSDDVYFYIDSFYNTIFVSDKIWNMLKFGSYFERKHFLEDFFENTFKNDYYVTYDVIDDKTIRKMLIKEIIHTNVFYKTLEKFNRNIKEFINDKFEILFEPKYKKTL